MIYIPVSIGELIDKLSILQVKKNKITESQKLSYVNQEFDQLHQRSKEYLKDNQILNLYEKLIVINTNLWEIEDKLRLLELSSKFEGEFIELARKVYFTNDERFNVKNKINQLTFSNLKEVKDYVDYRKLDQNSDI